MSASGLDVRNAQLSKIRNEGDARVIIAIYDDGVAVHWRKGLSGEDLRHELITEANHLRNHIEKEQRR